jgi:hypothetical protein
VRSVLFAQSPPFESYAFEMTSDESGAPRSVEGHVAGNALVMTTRLNGRTSTETIPFPEGTLFEEAVPYFLTACALADGQNVAVSLFNGDLLRPMTDRITAERTEPLTSRSAQRARVFRHRLEWMDGVEMTDWVDDDGSVLRTELEAFGAPMALVRVSPEEAVPAQSALNDMDLLVATRLTPEGGVPTDSQRLRARLWLDGGDLDDILPNTTRQTLVADSSGNGYLLDVRRDAAPVDSAPFPVGDASLAVFLEPTVYVESDDPTIRKVAADVVRDASDAWDAASRVNGWVYRAISDKNLNVGFGSARQTLESRSGDCTEHTVLAVALCRAVGIPARILSGVVWHRDGFYHHFWFEAYVGRWVAFDPTFGQTPADARHIQFNGGTLESNTALELGEGILRTLNRLRIALINE